jgi:hypothetical protein
MVKIGEFKIIAGQNLSTGTKDIQVVGWRLDSKSADTN